MKTSFRDTSPRGPSQPLSQASPLRDSLSHLRTLSPVPTGKAGGGAELFLSSTRKGWAGEPRIQTVDCVWKSIRIEKEITTTGRKNDAVGSTMQHRVPFFSSFFERDGSQTSQTKLSVTGAATTHKYPSRRDLSSSRASPLLLLGHSIFVLTIPFRCHAYPPRPRRRGKVFATRRELTGSFARVLPARLSQPR